MRRSLSRAPLLALACAAAVAASGCASTAVTNASTVVPPPAPSAEETTAIPALAGDLVVSTNEPFWQAQLVGNTLRLSGAGAIERTLTVVASSERSGRRVVRATDTAGSVVATIDATGCQDSMSGASFPLTGTLAIDDAAPFPGCARAGRVDGAQP